MSIEYGPGDIGDTDMEKEVIKIPVVSTVKGKSSLVNSTKHLKRS